MPAKKKAKTWFTYLLLCKDDSLYAGITTDLDQRLLSHQNGTGAKYTRSHGAVKFVYTKNHSNRQEASVHEAEIKKLSRKEKVNLVNSSKQIL